MIRCLAILGLLPLLAVVIALSLIHHPPSSEAISSWPPEVQAISSVEANRFPTAPAAAVESRISPAQVGEPDMAVASDEGRGDIPGSWLQPSASLPISPFEGADDSLDAPATSVSAASQEADKARELLELEITLLRDTNRDLLAALETLQNQLLLAQEEAAQWRARAQPQRP